MKEKEENKKKRRAYNFLLTVYLLKNLSVYHTTSTLPLETKLLGVSVPDFAVFELKRPLVLVYFYSFD